MAHVYALMPGATPQPRSALLLALAGGTTAAAACCSTVRAGLDASTSAAGAAKTLE